MHVSGGNLITLELFMVIGGNINIWVKQKYYYSLTYRSQNKHKNLLSINDLRHKNFMRQLLILNSIFFPVSFWPGLALFLSRKLFAVAHTIYKVTKYNRGEHVDVHLVFSEQSFNWKNGWKVVSFFMEMGGKWFKISLGVRFSVVQLDYLYVWFNLDAHELQEWKKVTSDQDWEWLWLEETSGVMWKSRIRNYIYWLLVNTWSQSI